MIAAYTGWMWVRQFDDADDSHGFRTAFEQSVKELSYLGYSAMENWTFLSRHLTAAEVREICHRYRTKMVCLYANIDEGIESLKRSVTFIAEIGGQWMIVASPNWPAEVTLDSPVDEAEIIREAAILNELGAYALERGVTILHNPHSYTPISRRNEIDRLMMLTDPECVKLCVDVGHSVISGVDAISLVKDYADRVQYIHVKDIDPHRAWRGRGQSWVPLGLGTVDLQGFLKTLREIQYSGVVCAGLPMGCEWINTFESARIAREYLRVAGGF